ncbi:MAG: histone deacetylase family protein, partial [Bauldia sp.]
MVILRYRRFPAGHPERPDRLRAIQRVLEDEAFQYLDRRE